MFGAAGGCVLVEPAAVQAAIDAALPRWAPGAENIEQAIDHVRKSALAFELVEIVVVDENDHLVVRFAGSSRGSFRGGVGGRVASVPECSIVLDDVTNFQPSRLRQVVVAGNRREGPPTPRPGPGAGDRRGGGCVLPGPFSTATRPAGERDGARPRQLGADRWRLVGGRWGQGTSPPFLATCPTVAAAAASPRLSPSGPGADSGAAPPAPHRRFEGARRSRRRGGRARGRSPGTRCRGPRPAMTRGVRSGRPGSGRRGAEPGSTPRPRAGRSGQRRPGSAAATRGGAGGSAGRRRRVAATLGCRSRAAGVVAGELATAAPARRRAGYTPGPSDATRRGGRQLDVRRRLGAGCGRRSRRAGGKIVLAAGDRRRWPSPPGRGCLDAYLEVGRARGAEGGALPDHRPGGAAAGRGRGVTALDVLLHVPGDGDYGVPIERGGRWSTRSGARGHASPESTKLYGESRSAPAIWSWGGSPPSLAGGDRGPPHLLTTRLARSRGELQ